jgi:hypothetical protein
MKFRSRKKDRSLLNIQHDKSYQGSQIFAKLSLSQSKFILLAELALFPFDSVKQLLTCNPIPAFFLIKP